MKKLDLLTLIYERACNIEYLARNADFVEASAIEERAKEIKQLIGQLKAGH